MNNINTIYLGVATLALSACATIESSDSLNSEGSPQASPETNWVYQSDLPISDPPFREVHCNWKDRLDQRYAYLEHVGPYSGTGALLPEVHRLLALEGVRPSGPPFALYYDDPSDKSPEGLRSRACVPVESWTQPSLPLKADTLPSRTVAYAVASGAYPNVPAVYSGIFTYMEKLNWALAGPIREIYLIPPSEVADYSELLCEVQIPVMRQ